MKKVARILSSIITVASLALVPGAVHAQTSDPIEVGSSSTTPTDATATTTTTPTTPATPDTGIAPAHNKVVLNSAVFMGGSALGAGLGYGYLTMRKKRFNK